MGKSPEMVSALDILSMSMFGRNRSDSIRSTVCVSCGKVVCLETEFKDALSRREFGISGFCQDCQDSVFGK